MSILHVEITLMFKPEAGPQHGCPRLCDMELTGVLWVKVGP